MRFTFHEGGMRVEALFGIRAIRAAQPEIDDFRRRCDQAHDVMTSFHRVQRWSVIHDLLPAALLIRRGSGLSGVVWLSYRRKFGIVLGLVKSGNLCGQGSVIAHPADHRSVLETAARVLMRKPLAHTVLLSGLWAPPGGHGTVPLDIPVPGIRAAWHFRDVRFRLDLAGGLDATMNRLGHKMRRNLRYYRRRAEDRLGCRFLADLSPAERSAAVAALSTRGAHPMQPGRAAAIDAALLDTPGHFAMGLRGADNEWLSFVAGWREPNGTQVDWQLNHDGHPQFSLSTVMRAYLLEHEATRGSPAIVFIGLTSEFWSRVCDPALCADLFATRAGMIGEATRWLTARLRPNGRIAVLQARAANARTIGR